MSNTIWKSNGILPSPAADDILAEVLVSNPVYGISVGDVFQLSVMVSGTGVFAVPGSGGLNDSVCPHGMVDGQTVICPLGKWTADTNGSIAIQVISATGPMVGTLIMEKIQYVLLSV
jgi:hypothetical protein